jgi:hypothetical protein
MSYTGFAGKKDEAATYSSACGSTIGAEELNGRVRNGNGWCLLAQATSSKSKRVWESNGDLSVEKKAKVGRRGACRAGSE